MVSPLEGTTEAIVGVQCSTGAEIQTSQQGGSDRTVKSRKWHWGRNARSIADVNASYDSAFTDRHNYRHWMYADHNSADASLRPEVRKKVRARARYEVLQNNPIGLGIVLTLANDTIGTGPRLQLGLKNEKYNNRIQRHWAEWSHAIQLTDKLHTLKMSKTVDGEGLGRITVNPYLETPVTLDFRLFECDRLEAPVGISDMHPNYVDGVWIDDYGNVVAYDILKHHPGSDYYFASNLEYDRFDARNIIHWFRPDRPEQHRGISECQTALALFALLRRFTLATVQAAETAADISLVMQTDMPVPDEFEDEANELMHDFWMDAVELERNSATVLPNGWNIKQIMATHPSTTYGMFKNELISEISRCIVMPYNIAAANSSEHNYASGRLDHQTYHQALMVERDRLNRLILDRLFNEWMHEAALTGGVLPNAVARKILNVVDKYGSTNIARVFPHTWHWDGFAHSDPIKEAQAQAIRLKSGTTHRALEYAKEGRDIDYEDKIAAEKSGMTVQEYRQALVVGTVYNGNAMSGIAQGVVDRSVTEETSEGGAEDLKITNEPPQLRQANEARRQMKKEGVPGV